MNIGMYDTNFRVSSKSRESFRKRFLFDSMREGRNLNK